MFLRKKSTTELEGSILIQRTRMKFSWLLLGALLMLGCSNGKDNRKTVFVLGVDDRASGGQSGVKFDLEKCDKYLVTALDESTHLKPVAKRSDKALRLQATIELASEQEPKAGDDSGVYRAVQVQLRLLPAPGSDGQSTISTGKAFLVQEDDSVQKNEGFSMVYKPAIDNAVKYMDVQLDARAMSTADIRKSLRSSDEQHRLYILRSLRGRKLPELYDDVLSLLHDRDNEVALEAIGFLVDQHDQRAVVPLIRMSHSRDPVFLLQLISALSELGGPVARGYLFTLASGHGSKDIRERATEALVQVDKILQKESESKSVSAAKSAAVSTKPVSTSTNTQNGGQR